MQKAARVLRQRQKDLRSRPGATARDLLKADHMKLAAMLIEAMMEKGYVSKHEYFGRVWTMVER